MGARQGGMQILIHGLSKEFESNVVLQEIDLDIKPGEFVAIVGRSGSGKSTLLRTIAGLEQPTDGQVLVDDLRTVGTHKELRLLFQNPRLLPWRKVVSNVQLGVASGLRERALEALKQVGLHERSNDWPYALSEGQRQKVALARAVVGKPRLLLLDEPFGSLDAVSRVEMQRLLEELWEDQGFTVILVTHDIGEAVALADRVLVMNDGQITSSVQIALARPRERDSGFAHYERMIYNRLLDPVLIEMQTRVEENADSYMI